MGYRKMKLIDHALKSGKRGGQINMCSALEELVNEGMEKGRQEGKEVEGWILSKLENTLQVSESHWG